MAKTICIAMILFSFHQWFFPANRTIIVPDSSLNNPRIPDVPPIKTNGFVLGMLKESFTRLLTQKYSSEKIQILNLKTSPPLLVVYKVDTGTIEHLVFYVYGNFLGKIQVVNLRPFDYPEEIINSFLFRYGRYHRMEKYISPEFRERGYHWRQYIWNQRYRYKPEFNPNWLDLAVNITVDMNMQERFVSRVVYEYAFDPEFLRLHFNTEFDW